MVESDQSNDQIYAYIKSLDSKLKNNIRKIRNNPGQSEKYYRRIERHFGPGLRQRVRRFINQNPSREELNRFISDQFRDGLIAVPRESYLQRLSFGLPYLMIGFMLAGAYWLAWEWTTRDEGKNNRPGDDETREKIEELSQSLENPLQD
ncbi:MAG: hypothetical protein ABEJ65_06780 [bacterium]